MNDHPREQLRFIILHYGPSICDAPKRCEALLRDLCPDNRREINMLTLALRAGVVQELLDGAKHALPAGVLIARQAQALHDSMGIAEPLAQWVVESWAIALGLPLAAASLNQHAAQSTPPQRIPTLPALQSPAELLKLATLRLEQAKQESQQKQRQTEFEAAWRSNTKIGRHGEYLPVSAPSWAAVLDVKAGLMWAVNESANDGFPNPCETMAWDDAMAWPNAVNAVGWCGFQDWRLPTKEELERLLVSEKQQGLHIRGDLFPDILVKNYYWVWTSSPYAGNRYYAWIVYFYDGNASGCNRGDGNYVRVVRSVQ